MLGNGAGETKKLLKKFVLAVIQKIAYQFLNVGTLMLKLIGIS